MTSSGLSQESLLRLFQGHIKDSAEENQIKEALKMWFMKLLLLPMIIC